MRFRPPADIESMALRLPAFLALCSAERWGRRIDQLANEIHKSPYLAKTIFERHWLELSISDYLASQGHSPEPEYARSFIPGLAFASMVMETYDRLSPFGRNNLAGRLVDGLKTDFAGLYLEIETAAELLLQDFDVSFPDFEGAGSYDLQFSGQGVEGEIECKSLSVDAGRKIHRHDFYRLIYKLSPHEWLLGAGKTVVVIELDGRLPTSDIEQQRLCEIISSSVQHQDGYTRSSGVSIRTEAISDSVMSALRREDACQVVQDAYGPNCHMAGGVSDSRGCFIVLRSLKEDDPSKPQLQALKAAAEQMSGNRPGIVALQFEDIEAKDLALASLRRRCSILAQALFNDDRYPFVAAVHHSAFGKLSHHAGNLYRPAFIFRRQAKDPSNKGFPFSEGPSTSLFAELVGADPKKVDPDEYVYPFGAQ